MTQFRKPMLCAPITYDEAMNLVDDSWVVELKLDGVRAMVIDGKLFDRRGKDISARFPEIEQYLGDFPPNVVFDGELIGQNGDFNEIAARMHLCDKLRIKILSKQSPARLVLFDAPSAVGTLQQRRQFLLAQKLPSGVEIIASRDISALSEAWRYVQLIGDEGLILKYKRSVYKWGCRSKSWLKLKAFKETEAVFVKYEHHNKGVTIETADGRRVVVNGEQSIQVVQTFKSKGTLLAAIQYLPQRDSEAWRFPSFRGIVKADDKVNQ